MKNPPQYEPGFVKSVRTCKSCRIHSDGNSCISCNAGVILSHLFSSVVMDKAGITLTQMAIDVCKIVAKTHGFKHCGLRKIEDFTQRDRVWGSIAIQLVDLEEHKKHSILTGLVRDAGTNEIIAQFKIKMG